MCTAATYCSGDFYFGRNLDYEFSYGEHVTIMPRNYPIRLHGGARNVARSDVPQDNRHRATPSRGPNGRARQGRTVQ